MYSVLIVIIYIAFIGLGLPDSLLGSAWPVLHLQMNVGVDFAGVISMIIAACTIVTSLLSDRLTYKFGTGRITAVSTALSAISLFAFSVSTEIWQICLWAVPYGLSAGAIDSSLNNYVALHYNSRLMCWLHCFWGVGAAISPYIMGWFLANGSNWQGGYRCISIIQLAIAILLFSSLFMWKATSQNVPKGEERVPPLGLRKSLQIKGVYCILIAFFGYCAAEMTCGLWASTYLVEVRNVTPETAARFASLFYLGITFGRFLNGFVADKIGDRGMIRLGASIAIFGAVLMMLPLKTTVFSLAGLLVFGFGCAPVYPCVIHSTPVNFGKENSQAIIGVQMASSYLGIALMPPLFGLIGRYISMSLYPFFLVFFLALLLIMSEKLYRITDSE